MKNNLRKGAVPVLSILSISIILTGCATAPKIEPVDVTAAAKAAAEKAVAEARPDIPPLPAECYVDTPHAALIEGNEATVTLRKERDQVDAANDKRYRCASFHNRLREGVPIPEAKGATDGQ